MRFIKKMIRNRRGQALVELALALPLIILLVMGTIEFGRIFHSYLLITNASREGARIAITGASDTEITDKINEVTLTLGSGVSSDVNRYGGNPNPVEVVVTYQNYLITPVLDTIVPNPITLTSTTTMKMEQ